MSEEYNPPSWNNGQANLPMPAGQYISEDQMIFGPLSPIPQNQQLTEFSTPSEMNAHQQSGHYSYFQHHYDASQNGIPTSGGYCSPHDITAHHAGSWPQRHAHMEAPGSYHATVYHMSGQFGSPPGTIAPGMTRSTTQNSGSSAGGNDIPFDDEHCITWLDSQLAVCKCGAKYTGKQKNIKSNYIRHVKSRNTTFRCPIRGCDRLFNRVDNVYQHIKSKHPEECDENNIRPHYHIPAEQTSIAGSPTESYAADYAE